MGTRQSATNRRCRCGVVVASNKTTRTSLTHVPAQRRTPRTGNFNKRPYETSEHKCQVHIEISKFRERETLPLPHKQTARRNSFLLLAATYVYSISFSSFSAPGLARPPSSVFSSEILSTKGSAKVAQASHQQQQSPTYFEVRTYLGEVHFPDLGAAAPPAQRLEQEEHGQVGEVGHPGRGD